MDPRKATLLGWIVIASVLALTACNPAGAPIAIVADRGDFSSVGSAATGEASVSDWTATSDSARAVTECFAATELVAYLPRALGRRAGSAVLFAGAGLPANGDAVVLCGPINDPRYARFQLPPPPAHADGFRIDARQDGARTLLFVRGRTRVGTLYGAYALLEQLGLTFDGLGDSGISPAKSPGPARALPRQLAIEEQPAYDTRGFWAWEPRGNHDFFLWMARNRMNFWTVEDKDRAFLKKLGMRLGAGGHHIQKAFLDPESSYPWLVPGGPRRRGLPREPYAPSRETHGDTNGDGRLSTFEAHPEWYGLQQGHRSANVGEQAGDNFCTTNRDAVRELTRRLLAELATGEWRSADELAFWMLDAGRWCGCPTCTAQGTPTDRLLALVAAVRRELDVPAAQKALGRPIRLTSLAFLETLPPPRRPVPPELLQGDVAITYFPIWRCYAHALSDEACREINVLQFYTFGLWRNGPMIAHPGALAVGEYYNVSSFHSMPCAYTSTMGTDLASYHAQGVRHFTTMHAPTSAWGTWTQVHVVLARLLWNPGRSAQDLSDRFVARYYPSTAEPMRRFYIALDTATRNMKVVRHEVRVGTNVFRARRQIRMGGTVFALRHFRPYGHVAGLDSAPGLDEIMAALQDARYALDEALRQSPSGVERARLDEVAKRFAYGQAMWDFDRALIEVNEAHITHQEQAAREAFVRLARARVVLQGIVDQTVSASSDCNAKTGYEATEATDLFDRFEGLYGFPHS